MKPRVICVPGSVAPAAQRYKPLLDGVAGEADLHLKDLEVYREPKPPADLDGVAGEADLHLKDLEVYREPKPPAGYSIDEELSAVDRLADGLGLARFHLVGYSGG